MNAKLPLLISLLLVSLPTFSLQAKPGLLEYRSFKIDESQLREPASLEDIRRAIKEQIDIVCEVGLAPETLEFFQSVPFVVIPAQTISRASPGLYSQRDRSVRVSSRIVSIGRRPVLLHELLHAYHHQRLPDGNRNRDVLRHYEHGKKLRAYAAKSHMLQNPGEFFACGATTYLFGVTAQEPFRRQKLQDSQPEYFEFLKAQFGSKAGKHEGTLADAVAGK